MEIAHTAGQQNHPFPPAVVLVQHVSAPRQNVSPQQVVVVVDPPLGMQKAAATGSPDDENDVVEVEVGGMQHCTVTQIQFPFIISTHIYTHTNRTSDTLV